MSEHHTHELSDHPEVQWALELLKPDPTYQPSILQKYATEIVCVGFGFTVASFRNWHNARPFYSGLQGHAMSMVVGYLVSQPIKKFVEDYQAERDTRMRDYIIRHPELFPEPERIKYSQAFESWTPLR